MLTMADGGESANIARSTVRGLAVSREIRKAFRVWLADGVSYTGLSRSKLYELMKEGAIASFQVGGRRMFLRQALDGFFERLSAA